MKNSKPRKIRSGICKSCGLFTRTLKKTSNGSLCLPCYSEQIQRNRIIEREKERIEQQIKETIRLFKRLNIPLEVVKQVFQKGDWDLEFIRLETFAKEKSKPNFRYLKGEILKSTKWKNCFLLYPASYLHYSKKDDRLRILPIDWERMFFIEDQQKFWRLSSARQNYQCLLCENEIKKGKSYQKFWKAKMTMIHLCPSCFTRYKTENKELFHSSTEK